MRACLRQQPARSVLSRTYTRALLRASSHAASSRPQRAAALDLLAGVPCRTLPTKVPAKQAVNYVASLRATDVSSLTRLQPAQHVA